MGVSWEESCAYMGISMCDLIADEGREAAYSRYEREGRSAFCPVHFMRHVLKQEEVDVVVTTVHVRMERAAILAARDLGVTSARIDDLLGYSMLGPYGGSVLPRLLPEQEWPDHVVVLNDEVRARIVTEGFPGERVHPLGQPVFADWQNAFNARTVSPALQHWYTAKRPIVVYAATSIPGIFNAQFDKLLRIAEAHPDWGVCIKLHPSMSEQAAVGGRVHIPENVRIVSNEDIVGVVKGADVVIIDNSTVGFLCAFNDVPLIVLDQVRSPYGNPLVTNGAAVGVNDLDELEPALIKLIDSWPASDRQDGQSIFENPPNASERIANWLSRIAANSEGHRPI